MTQLSKNFKLSEFAVSAGRPDLVKPVPANYVKNVEHLVNEFLQPFRDWWRAGISISSGYRPPALNTAIGGSPTSQHTKAEAADWITADTRAAMFAIVSNPRYKIGQVIYYPRQNFIHVATPSTRYARPTFFVSLSPKEYTLVVSVTDLANKLR